VVAKIRKRAQGAELVEERELPLTTRSRYIVNRFNERVKWACINWFGAFSSGQMVVGGLEVQRLEDIVQRILEMGFNCVRLPWSVEGYFANPEINNSFVEANPRFMNQGKKFLDVFDATVKALTDSNIMVILNNHISKSTWCCLWPMEDGLWYTKDWPEEKWIESVVGMAERYTANKMVVAHDIRNEPHDYAQNGVYLTWGDGNKKTDLKAAQERAGNRILQVAPDTLIVVEAPCFDSDFRDVREHPMKLDVEHKVVYQAHNYVFFMDSNYFSVRFESWEVIESMFLKTLLCLLSAALLLVSAWRYVGSPKPPPGLMSFTLGLSMVLFGSIFLFVWAKTLPTATKLKACHYGMPKDYASIPHIYWTLLIGGTCLLIFSAFRVSMLRNLSWDRFHDLEHHNDDYYCNWCKFCGAHNFGSLYIISRLFLKSVRSVLNYVLAALLCRRRSASRTMSRSDDTEQAMTDGSGKGSAIDAKVAVSESDDSDSREDEEATLTSHEDEAVPDAQWDHCVCTSFTVFVVLMLVSLACIGMYSFSRYARSYLQLEQILVQKWGFILQDGHEYTAPVWLGEFGDNTRGNYWLHLMKFLSEWDVDWAYWPLNGNKFVDQEHVEKNAGLWGIFMGTLDVTIKYITPHWEEETWGLMYPDYMTVRRPWLLQDLQAIMPSPVAWTPAALPCEREYMGAGCGG
jgi:hypothetical protein